MHIQCHFRSCHCEHGMDHFFDKFQENLFFCLRMHLELFLRNRLRSQIRNGNISTLKKRKHYHRYTIRTYTLSLNIVNKKMVLIQTTNCLRLILSNSVALSTVIRYVKRIQRIPKCASVVWPSLLICINSAAASM